MTPEEKRQYIKDWRKRNPDKVKAYRDKTNSSESGKLSKYRWAERNRERTNERAKIAKRKFRQECLDFLGGKCQCCSEETYEFLAIDHVSGGGSMERKMITSQQLYRKIVKEQISEGYRILCHNCNMAIAFYETCPHINAEA